MYTRQETAKQKQAFWTAFGRYMKPILSADGESIGWLNYKTGNKFVRCTMDVDTRQATISIILDHPEADKRQLYFQRFVELQPILYESLGEQDWIWQSDAFDEHGRPESIIYKQITGVNIFRNEDWPTIISFFKPRIIAFDECWSMVRYQFSGFL
jgi:hypothetical protein